jgi:glutathione synthase/RimK-type ligase-like ATP-grasp enzyme
MRHSVLILAPNTDPHASAVAWALEQQGVDAILTPSLQARPGVHYSFHIDAQNERLQDSTLSDRRISAVWNRRLHDPQPACAEEDRSFASLEWRMFQRNLFSLADIYHDALWVNRVPEAIRAENKLAQLSLCRRLGLPFPDTVVTTDADQVDELRKKWGRIIFKSFLTHHWEDQETGKKHAVGVALLDRHSDLPAESIAICPGIYQRYIEKACDIRVTVIGQHLFPLSLRKATSGGFVDWRPYSNAPELKAEAITLPTPVEEKLRTLMRELGLVFGCIDLAVDHDGNYYFLEVNQAGQFLFVEDLCPTYPILQTLAALLASGQPDVDAGALKGVNMATFRTSEAYAELKQRAAKATLDKQLFTLE